MLVFGTRLSGATLNIDRAEQFVYNSGPEESSDLTNGMIGTAGEV
jgi:hypothetical protein